MTERSYWFYLEPYVYAVVKGDVALLYNTHSGEALLYKKQPLIAQWVRRLRSKKNLYITKLTAKQLSEPGIARFLYHIRKRLIGDLIDTTLSDGKPFLMMPVLDIERDVETFKKGAPEMVGRDIMGYLSEMSVYINNVCDRNCSICRHAYRQFLYCYCDGRRYNELDTTIIDRLIEETAGSSLVSVNILGGDIFKYSRFEELLVILNRSPALKSFYVHFQNLVGREENLRLFSNTNSELNVLVHFPLNRRVLAEVAQIVDRWRINANYIFALQSDGDVTSTEEIVSNCDIEDPVLRPLFNGRNRSFFQKHVFINKKMILEAKPSFKEIFERKAVNSHFFGKLTILNNSEIYAGMNGSPLGRLSENSIYDAVYKEMFRGRSWRRVRSGVEPCRRCVFDALCPPLSNYESVLGQNNMCRLWK